MRYMARDGTWHNSLLSAQMHSQMHNQMNNGPRSGKTSLAGLVLIGILVWAFSSSDWRPGDLAQFLSNIIKPPATKSWCLGLVSQIEAREAMRNPGALLQIPPIRQQFVEQNCQSYGIRMP